MKRPLLGETGVATDVSLRWRVKAIEADHPVTPTVEFRLEDHEAGLMPRLVKVRKAQGLAPPGKSGAEVCSCKGGRLEVCPYFASFD